MSLTEPPVCPICHQLVAAKTLRERMSGYFFSAGNKAGVICDSCGAQLKVGRTAAFFIVAIGILGAFAIAYYIAIIRAYPNRSLERVLGLLGMLLVVVLTRRLAVYYLRLENAAPNEQLYVYSDSLETPATRSKRVTEELECESELAAAREMMKAEQIDEINDPVRRPWRCPRCSSDNPATFDICWKCEQAKLASDI